LAAKKIFPVFSSACAQKPTRAAASTAACVADLLQEGIAAYNRCARGGGDGAWWASRPCGRAGSKSKKEIHFYNLMYRKKQGEKK
jgi:hypothetical protein